LEYYTSRTQNAFASNGLLHIVARREVLNGFNYTSARLKSQGLFSKLYGRIEFRAKLPEGVGFWPALWLLGTNITSVSWPACGEIDVVESNGSQPNSVQGSIHFGTSATRVYPLPNESITNFHCYLLEWTTNAVLWYVDGVLYQTQTNWWSSTGPYPAPFNKPFFLIMNLAIGGNYVGNPSVSAINAGAAFPSEMLVDYVRIYERTSPLRLSMRRTNTNLLLNWPSNIISHLEVSTGFAYPFWENVPTTGNQWLISPASQSAFFRVASP
jgi:beta-glucanase (GH16 family)